MDKIAIAKPRIGVSEIHNVMDVLKSGMLAYGEKTKQFETNFANKMGAAHAIAVNSGTSALFCAYKALGFKEGDEVICTSFTFAATSDMIKAVGATPVFVDIKDDFNIDEEQIEASITDKTVGIVVVHLFGKPCNMKRVMEIANKYNLVVVEDCAQACGARIDGQAVGTFGNIGCFSFYPTKLMTTGEGGMCITNDPELAEKIYLIKNHGMHGLSYDYSMVGFNFNMSDVAGSIGLAQLDRLDTFIFVRKEIANRFNLAFGAPNLPLEELNTTHVYNNYSFLVDNREDFIKQMDANGIVCRVYYPTPLAELPNATRISKKIVSIPIRPNLSSEEIYHIIDNALAFAKFTGVDYE